MRFSPFSNEVRDLKVRRIIAALQDCGVAVIGQPLTDDLRRPYDVAPVTGADVSAFFKRFGIGVPIVVGLPRATFEEEFDRREWRSEGDWALARHCKWVPFTAVRTDEKSVGQRLAAQFKQQQTVILTRFTANALADAWALRPPIYCAAVLRAILWLIVRYVIWSGRPLALAIHHRGRSARLWQLRVEGVARFFVPPEQSRRLSRCRVLAIHCRILGRKLLAYCGRQVERRGR